jgi:hypothetical protein
MPKFILATATFLLRRSSTPSASAIHDPTHEAIHASTRSRDATRRLRATAVHDPYVDLSPLDLTRRH